MESWDRQRSQKASISLQYCIHTLVSLSSVIHRQVCSREPCLSDLTRAPDSPLHSSHNINRCFRCTRKTTLDAPACHMLQLQCTLNRTDRVQAPLLALPSHYHPHHGPLLFCSRWIALLTYSRAYSHQQWQLTLIFRRPSSTLLIARTKLRRSLRHLFSPHVIQEIIDSRSSNNRDSKPRMS